MEQASQNASWPDEQADPEVARFEDRTADSLGHVLSAVRTKQETDPAELPRERDKQDPRDWSAALKLVHQAAEAMRAGGDRARKLEAHTQSLLERMSNDLQDAQARLEAAEARTHASEARAKQAEARAKEAETWLRRIHDAILEELPSGMNLLESASRDQAALRR